MSKSHAKMADREKLASDKHHSNPGGAYEFGRLFVHFQPSAYRHSARYELSGIGDSLKCSVCGREV